MLLLYMYAELFSYKKIYSVVICSIISVVVICAKGYPIAGTNIICEGKTSQPWTLFCKRFMPREIFCIKRVVHCHFFMWAHVFPNCSCENFALFTIEDTSSHSYCASFFFARIFFLSKKGFPLKKKRFYDKIMFIYLHICAHMYTNICPCIITLFF